MLIPVKHSVAVMIFKEGKVLSVRRPDHDDEVPGIWGLPAGTFRHEETIDDLIARIGREKLGVELASVRKLMSGRQMRQQYLLEMDLWEATMKGTPARGDWQWATIESLQAGANAGSLCCELALKSGGRVSCS